MYIKKLGFAVTYLHQARLKHQITYRVTTLYPKIVLMAANNQTGTWGEDKACAFLIENGYEILERNYRYKFAEIDLIARINKTLTFIEVKTRSGTGFGMPEEFVSSTKAKLIMKAAENYIFTSDWKHDIRFDVISILILPNGQLNFRHIQDAFY